MAKQPIHFLLINQSDVKRNKDILNFRYPMLEEIQEMYQKIADYLQVAVNTLPEEEFEFNIESFAKKYDFNITKTFHTLQFLENEDLIKLLDNSFGSSKIRMAINNADLYKFQIANSYFDNFIRIILRKFPGIFNNNISIKEKKLSNELNISEVKLINILQKLEQKGIISYIPKHGGTHLVYLQNRLDSKRLNISKERLQEAKEYSNKKLEEIIAYAYNRDECRSILLLKYFGENSKERCQVCDYCVKENRKTLKQKDFEEISKSIIKLLDENELNIEEIIDSLKEIKKDKIENVIQYLFDKDKISKHGNKYSRI